MSRIAQVMADLKASNRKALVPYIVAGDPTPSHTVALMHGLVEAGADIIELGVPFSDPMAEGPSIARGHERALEYRVSLRDVLDMVTEFRAKDSKTPVVLMGYANPIERMGYDVFSERAYVAGVDGVLTVDLPPEESGALAETLHDRGIDTIFLVSPTTSDQRAKEIVKNASGYIYYVSLKGVTGAANLDVDEVSERINLLRSYTDLPLCVGFGIKDAESAKAVSSAADGAVVGSVLVNACGELADAPVSELVSQVSAIIGDMRSALG
jgi:tryptophan synthase alpha chain